MRGKFDILFDRGVVLTDYTTDLWHSYKRLKCNIPLKGENKSQFTAGATTGRGLLYLLCLADQQDPDQGALVTPTSRSRISMLKASIKYYNDC